MREHQRPAIPENKRKGIHEMKYSTMKKIRKGTMCLLVMIIIGLAVANIMLDRQKSWDVEYEMVNKHIEWTWAGR